VHDPEKWIPVFRKDHAPTKNLDHDPIYLTGSTVQASIRRHRFDQTCRGAGGTVLLTRERATVPCRYGGGASTRWS
jgi:hypothetical protein